MKRARDRHITAESIVLVDKNRRRRILLEVNQGTAVVKIFDAIGVTRASIGVTERGEVTINGLTQNPYEKAITRTVEVNATSLFEIASSPAPAI